MAQLSSGSRPLTLDLDRSDLSKRMSAKAGPTVLFRRIAKSTLYRIAMDVPELRSKTRSVSNIVIEIASLPKRSLAFDSLLLFTGLNGDLGLEAFHGVCDRSVRRLAHQQVNMLGHHHVTPDVHLEAASNLFEGVQECALDVHLRKKRLAMVTTECEEVSLPGMMKAIETVRHGAPLTVKNY